MKKLFLITSAIILLSTVQLMYAQEGYLIKGKVVTQTGEALQGAMINEKGKMLFAYTNEAGEFEYNASRPHADITITLEGYHIFKANAGDDFSNVIMYEHKKAKRTWHLQFSFLNEELSFDLPDSKFDKCTSNYGAGFTWGKTFNFIGKKNGSKTVRLGICADWLNANYSYYEFTDMFFQNTMNSTFTHMNAGMQVGPMITLFPDRKFNIQLYGKYSPCYSIMALEFDEYKNVYSGFTNGFVAGGNISIGFFGIGIEYRSHSGKYTSEIDDMLADMVSSIKQPEIAEILNGEPTTKLGGYRAYITFKF